MNIAELAKSVYLDEVLQYHIVPALVTTAEMTSGYTLATQCLGHSMWISSIPARPEALFTINGVDPLEEGVATVVTPNLHAGKVITPCSLSCTAALQPCSKHIAHAASEVLISPAHAAFVLKGVC